MVLIPIGMQYQTTVKGATAKQVFCEKCGTEYVYILERVAKGNSMSPLFLDNEGAAQHSSDRAHRELGKSLKNDCDIAPCPACGWLQRDMVRAIRRKRVVRAIPIWFVGAVFCLIGSMILWRLGMQLSFGAIELAWIGLIVAYVIHTLVRDLNVGDTSRLTTGKSIMLRKDFDAAALAARGRAKRVRIGSHKGWKISAILSIDFSTTRWRPLWIQTIRSTSFRIDPNRSSGFYDSQRGILALCDSIHPRKWLILRPTTVDESGQVEFEKLVGSLMAIMGARLEERALKRFNAKSFWTTVISILGSLLVIGAYAAYKIWRIKNVP